MRSKARAAKLVEKKRIVFEVAAAIFGWLPRLSISGAMMNPPPIPSKPADNFCLIPSDFKSQRSQIPAGMTLMHSARKITALRKAFMSSQAGQQLLIQPSIVRCRAPSAFLHIEAQFKRDISPSSLPERRAKTSWHKLGQSTDDRVDAGKFDSKCGMLTCCASLAYPCPAWCPSNMLHHRLVEA